MDLPLSLQMQLDISVQAHKREIADGFAKLKAKLLPEPKRDPGQEQLRALMEAMRPAAYPYSAQAMATQANMLGNCNPLAANNARGYTGWGLLGASALRHWF